ncbi:hypothetical protein [Paenibacillus sp. NEAU-GSW1]|uniref:hypothetical protein n=1 Tax=Paenibacillus sp. NEAU-GSW1 TaxID=2682486 RepID=UPI0012E10F34|nr:hypothetical protein [Paenibacillus sp. NEAU-GSW1]MUT68598.1 hypothetical protein [Paenibacillus sp. NEAU-GSW1]
MAKSINQLLKTNNELSLQLNETNAAILTDIVVYLRVSDISELQAEQIRHDLLDMTLAAQERGEDLPQVIGSDYKAFCNEILGSAAPKSAKEKAKEATFIVTTGLASLLLIQLFFMKDAWQLAANLLAGRAVDYNLPLSLGFVISTIVIIAFAWIITSVIGKRSFHYTEKVKKRRSQPVKVTLKSALWGMTLVAAVASYLIVIVMLEDVVLFDVHALVLIGSIVLLFLLGRLAK